MKSEMYMPNYKGKLGIFFLQTLSNKNFSQHQWEIPSSIKW